MSRRLQDKEILSILQNIREDESDCGSESAERDSDDDCAVPQFSSSSSSEESDLEDQVPLATLQNVHSSTSRGHGRGGAGGRGRGRGRGRSHSSDDSELQGLITATDEVKSTHGNDWSELNWYWSPVVLETAGAKRLSSSSDPK
ncbi:hypothetical protein ACJJTC_011621 [Scirpophaga incertulas]